MTKRGSDPALDKFAATCTYCKSEYEAQRKELKIEDTQRDGAFAHATCEVCDKDMIFYPAREKGWSEQMGR